MRYIPNSPADREAMLAEIGVDAVEDLFESIPENLRLKRRLNLPDALTEPELIRYFDRAARQNHAEASCFLGAGSYLHHIPVIIDSLVSRSEFLTMYTPYQAELAQGMLQATFEFQTFMAELTGMDVVNASLYDGSTGLAEAVLMAHRVTRRDRFVIARSVHPEYRSVVQTYTAKFGFTFEDLEFTEDGRVDMDRLEALLEKGETAAVVIQSPNFFGTIEFTAEVSRRAHAHGALSIVTVAEAMSLGLVRAPGSGDADSSADIVVGEAQSFGVPMNFGGPGLGYIGTSAKHVHQVPGRLAGMAFDDDGQRGFVLTLAAREQHIRRERATSNICTNESLCAVMTAIYLASVGPRGLREIAEQNVQKTAYAVSRIEKDTPHTVLFPAPRFNEFVVALDGDLDGALERARRRGIYAGLGLGRFYPELSDALLLSVTEVHTREDIDRLVEALR